MSVTEDTLGLVKTSKDITNDVLAKAYTQSGSATSGITYYDLEPAAKSLVPVITPLRNIIPRESGKGGIQANWRAITGINKDRMSVGVGEGNRGGAVNDNTSDYIAVYKELGLENSVTFKADLAARGFDDVKALAVRNLLWSLMVGEEQVDLGGNTSVALGTTPTPSGTGATTGGLLASGNWSVICVALSHDAYMTGSVAGGIRAAVSRTNTDGSSEGYGGGAARQSSAATINVASGSTGKLSVSVAAVNNAFAYAWFWGSAGNEVLGAITTINSIVITDVAAGTQTAASLGTSDNSQNALVYDGLLTQACKSGSGSYVAVQATGTAGTGTPLTSDGVGGCVEINAALRSFWDNYRLSPDTMWVNAQEMNNIVSKILSTSNGAQRYVFDSFAGNIVGGSKVPTYLNRFTMGGAATIDIKLHPNVPPGTILFLSMKIPYPLSNVANPIVKRCRQDYAQYEWPLRSRKYEFGVYLDCVLQHYFPPSIGIITNIGNG